MSGSVLVVEDSPAQAALLVADLTAAGFSVRHVPDGEAALASLLEEPFDIVLSDVVMPGIDGYELCRRAKELDRDLPVVLLTSLDDPIEIVRALDAGADNFLRKPYLADQLVSRVRTMLYHREMRVSGRAAMGLEVMLRDKRFLITAERQQILDLLVSSFEDLVTSNRDLRSREVALTEAEVKLRAQLDATEASRRRISTILDAAPHAMVIIDDAGTITDVSDRMCELVGIERRFLLGQPVDRVSRFFDGSGQPLPIEERPIANALASGGHVEAGTSFDLFLQRSDGSLVPVIARAAPVRDRVGHTMAMVGVLQEIGTLSAHDRVTKLPNQTLFADRVARALATAEVVDRAGPWVAVVAIVLDRFATLSENLTPAEIDVMLGEVADRLRRCVTDPDTGVASGSAGYFGRDLFAAVLPGLEDELDGVHRAQAMAAFLTAEPVQVGDAGVAFSVTVGVAVDDGTSDDSVGLVSSAVAAARRPDRAGPGRVEIADPAVNARAGDWLRRESELREAIEAGQLLVHYQPEVNLRTGRVWGVEALVRWQHPEHGLLRPDAFLPLADESGLIAPLGWYVLREACRQAVAWRHEPFPGAATLSMSVNIDATQLGDADLAGRVAAVLDETGLAPDRLILEVTEHGVTGEPQQTAARLRELKALGVRIAIDDFGTGYSSLTQLRHFPVDLLKVDQTFVARMTEEAEDAAIVASTIRLARELGIVAVAEGVETEEQLVGLRQLDCDLAQGYHWAPPMAAGDLATWCAANPQPGGLVRSIATTSDVVPVDEAVAFLVQELRSPLTIIGSRAAHALEADPHDAMEVLQAIRRSAGELDRRISMLDDMRMADQGALHLQLEQIAVDGLVDRVVSDLLLQLVPHEITSHGEPGLVVRGDPTRLGQAIANLLYNAAAFSPPTAPIEISVVGADDIVEISVRDHGEGVAADRRPELFRRFARLGSHRQGVGIGLYLARSIARAHGGEAGYEPAPDGGSTFTISLPRVPTP
ncbi:MAG TPA: EAL domain-containing protein [Acidimicrobiales bacterium]